MFLMFIDVIAIKKIKWDENFYCVNKWKKMTKFYDDYGNKNSLWIKKMEIKAIIPCRFYQSEIIYWFEWISASIHTPWFFTLSIGTPENYNFFPYLPLNESNFLDDTFLGKLLTRTALNNVQHLKKLIEIFLFPSFPKS